MSDAVAPTGLAASTEPHDSRAFMLDTHDSSLNVSPSIVAQDAMDQEADADGGSDENRDDQDAQEENAQDENAPSSPAVSTTYVPCEQMNHIWGKQFRTQEEAIAFVVKTAEEAGFLVRVKGHRPCKAEAHTAILCCDRARKPRRSAPNRPQAREVKRRATTSKCTDCPWNCRVKQQRPGWPWEVHRVNSERGNTHNHALDGVWRASKHRMAAVRERGDYILREWYRGVRPGAILKAIKAEGTEAVLAITGSDVHNFLTKHKQLADERDKAIRNAVWAGVTEGADGQTAPAAQSAA